MAMDQIDWEPEHTGGLDEVTFAIKKLQSELLKIKAINMLQF